MISIRAFFKKEAVLLILIVVLSFFLRINHLDYNQGKTIFDETEYRRSVLTYVRNEDDFNFAHPPLGKEILASGIRLFGDNALGWRFPSVVFSIFGLLIIYFFTKDLFKNRFVSLAATFFLSLDFMYFIHSRLLTMEVIYLFFFWTTLFLLWKFYQSKKIFYLVLGIVLFSLTMATKWTGFFALIPFFLLFLFKKDFKSIKLLIIGLFYLSPLIYTITYLPYILRNSLIEYINVQIGVVGFWMSFSAHGLRYDLLQYILNHAFVWPLNFPWAYFSSFEDNKVHLVLSMYHPFLYYLAEFYLLKEIWSSIKRSKFKFNLAKNYLKGRLEQFSKNTWILLLFILSFSIPWLFVTRIQYLYYLLPAIPFLYVFLALKFQELYQKDRLKFYAFILTAIFVFVYFYPLISNWVVSNSYIFPFQ